MGGDRFQNGDGEIAVFFFIWIAGMIGLLGFILLIIAAIAHAL